MDKQQKKKKEKATSEGQLYFIIKKERKKNNTCSKFRIITKEKETSKSNAENQHALPIGLFLSLRSLWLGCLYESL